ncbi:MAG TPA: hypothetical protein DEB40_05865 [Elusimicrobia bacterium]|nr:hypothetical protein [Elusimicrobiota bacterium]HBT61252.1 hypothetical protein [Elusimicrobiota bacterium]
MHTGDRVAQARHLFLLAWLWPVAISIGLSPGLYAQARLSRTTRAGVQAAGQQAIVAVGSAFSVETDIAALFPKLRSSLKPAQDLGVLKRVLAQTRLEPRELAAMPVAARAERIADAVKGYARKLAEEAAVKTRPASNPVESIMELTSLKYRFEDMLDAIELIELKNPRDIDRALVRHAAVVDTALIDRSDALAKKIIAALPDTGNVVWHGRTAVVPAGDDGGAVALKFARPGKGVEDEGAGLERAGRFGVDAPAPLPGRGGYVRLIDEKSPQAKYGTAFMAYLLPGKLAGDFFSYLGDPLPKNWSRDQKAQAVRASALKAVDGMLRLQENGWYHETLAPISHSGDKWRWDFWRTAGRTTLLELSRFGPTNIHNWDDGLSYANVRLSGLADFEHLTALDMRGQNIFELSMLVIRAGYRNRLGARSIAKILAEVLQRHASGVSEVRQIDIDRAVLLPLARGIVRRFYAFYAMARVMPRSLVRHFNEVASRVSVQRIPEGAALVMFGEILHPLIIDVIKPYIEALTNDHFDSVGLDDPETPYRHRQIFSDEIGARIEKSVRFAVKPALGLLFGIETEPYPGRPGRLRQPWIWRQGADPAAQARRKEAAALIGWQDTISPALIGSALEDPDVWVRRYAAAALQGRQDAYSLMLIARALDDPDTAVRRYAARALRGRKEPGSLALVQRTLADPDTQVRLAGAEALQGRQDADAWIEKALEDENADVRRAAAESLIGRQDDNSPRLIKKALTDQNADARHAAAKALIGRKDAGSLTLIENLLAEKNDADARRYAAMALQGRKDAALPRLIGKALHDPDAQVRIYAAGALQGLQGAILTALMMKALIDPDADVRGYAAMAIIGLRNADAPMLIDQALLDPDKWVRRYAAIALHGRPDPYSLTLIAKALDNPDAEVRRYAAMALQGRQDAGSLTLIDKALADPDIQARRAAAKALLGRKDTSFPRFIGKVLAARIAVWRISRTR